MGRLQDQIAIVTGGGTGIGRGISLAYAREGAVAVIANRREETGNRVVQEIESNGGRALFVQTDICSLQDVDHLVRRTVDTFGRIDILVNNAGVATSFAPFLELTPEMYDLVVNTNLRGTFFLTQRVARVMAKQEARERSIRGKIVMITSNIADIAQPETAHYSSTKGGLNSLTRVLALELSDYGICVNAIAPGEIYVESAKDFFDDPANKPRFDAVPLRRFGHPEDVAGAAIFLASSESDYITGTITVIDGGQLIV
jgi:NAD(P)-dependent dehydrogenase (short-subunit alcohol dehydrogenase family)